MTKSNQKCFSQILPSLDHISMQKGLRYQLIPYRHTDDQRILQSGWTGGKPGYTLPRVVVSGATFP